MAGFVLPIPEPKTMANLTTFCRHPQDEPILQQLETYLQYLSNDNKAAIAIAALYEATEPQAVYSDYICKCYYPKLSKSIALVQELSKPGKLALARAILEELAVLEQLQGATK